MSLGEHVERLTRELHESVRRHYGDTLVSLAVFGSMGRGTPRPDSDLDLLIVADGLPNGRLARLQGFARVEADLASRLAEGRRQGFFTECSPVFKTRDEVAAGGPLLLDMIEDANILFDRDGFFRASIACAID